MIIQHGKTLLGCGEVGQVYELDNFPGMVIKVPCNYSQENNDLLKLELEAYTRLKDLDILAPLRAVKLGSRVAKGEEYIGLVKPMLETSYEAFKGATDEPLRTLREGFIDLSECSYRSSGLFQVGIDFNGNFQLYDMDKASLIPAKNKATAYSFNNSVWYIFLYRIGARMRGYGDIKPR